MKTIGVWGFVALLVAVIVVRIWLRPDLAPLPNVVRTTERVELRKPGALPHPASSEHMVRSSVWSAPTRSVDCLVLGDGDRPVSNAEFVMSDGTEGPRTDLTGRCRLNLDERGAHVVAAGYVPQSLCLPPDDVEHAEELVITLRRGKTIRGRVVSEDGSPLQGVHVFAALGPADDWGEERGRRPRMIGDTLAMHQVTSSDEVGEFALSGIDQDIAFLGARKEGYVHYAEQADRSHVAWTRCSVGEPVTIVMRTLYYAAVEYRSEDALSVAMRLPKGFITLPVSYDHLADRLRNRLRANVAWIFIRKVEASSGDPLPDCRFIVSPAAGGSTEYVEPLRRVLDATSARRLALTSLGESYLEVAIRSRIPVAIKKGFGRILPSRIDGDVSVFKVPAGDYRVHADLWPGVGRSCEKAILVSASSNNSFDVTSWAIPARVRFEGSWLSSAGSGWCVLVQGKRALLRIPAHKLHEDCDKYLDPGHYVFALVDATGREITRKTLEIMPGASEALVEL